MPYIVTTISPSYNDEVYSLDEYEGKPKNELYASLEAAQDAMRAKLKELFRPSVSTYSGGSSRDWSFGLGDFGYGDYEQEFPLAGQWAREEMNVDGETWPDLHWHQFIDWMEEQGKDWLPHVPELLYLTEVEFIDS
jgi:hypothetical protein